ncbi:MAG: hypothetical protein K2O60_06660 [Ruminococcus sp.]|nr:hypothetical protein [Ruminococcus sp.]
MLTVKFIQEVQLAEEKTWEIFMEGINGFTDDYIQIMESRFDDSLPDNARMFNAFGEVFL